jgi:two-component system cell cycle sensor histidine kinase/response regulator CckA
VLAISDSGTGISQPVLDHIFEPFFTTKPEGQGTGLGLAVVKEIVAQHQGYISIASTEGQGSTFEVFLPACTDQYPATQEESRPRITGGTESLLLVEDSDPVRDLARLILRGVGYRVIEARDGVEAMEIYAAQHQNIDLVILDVVLPRLGGRQVMAQMQAINPAIKLVFTSGYAYRGLHTNFIHAQGLPFIQKPYSTDVLCERIRHLLDGT